MREFKITKRTGYASRFDALLTPTKITFIQDQLYLSSPTPPLLSREIETHGVADALQKLLDRWNAPTTVVCSFLKHHHFEEWERRSNLKQAPILFQLIEDLVHTEEERFELMKFFLEEDLALQYQSNYPYSKWHQCWDEVLKCKEWCDAKELLLENKRCLAITQAAGKTFMSATLVVIAEQLLLVCKSQIEYPEKYKRPLTPCDNDKKGSFMLFPKLKFLEILRDFRQSKWTVSPFFYRYALEIIDVESLLKKFGKSFDPNKEENIDLPTYLPYNCFPLNSSSRSYLRISDISKVCSSNNSDQKNFLSSMSGAHLYSSPTAINALSTLIANQKTQYFNDYAHSLIFYDGYSLSIFNAGSSPNFQPLNLFSLLATNENPSNHLPLVMALLKCFSNISRSATYKPLLLTWLRSLLLSSTWEAFTTQFSNPEIRAHLKLIMGDAGKKLVEDAIVLMISERFMLLLRERSKTGKRGARLAKKRGKEGYIAILRVLNERGLRVDFRWYNYLYSLW